MLPDLEIGDVLPDFALKNQRQNVTLLSRRALGKPILVLFCPDLQKPACQTLLRGFAARHDELAERAHLFVINNETPAANAQGAELHALPFEFLLADAEHRAAGAYGVTHNIAPGGDFMGAGAFTSFLASANRRVLRIDRDVTDPGHADQILAFLEALPTDSPERLHPRAPLLYVPGVFDAEFCRRLIAVHETQGSASRGVLRTRRGGLGAEVQDDSVKIRRDHVVADPAVRDAIERHLMRRVLPEIAKAFCYRVTAFEQFKIACYDASTGGYFRPHRDNVTVGSAHRRFAMTLNLNTGDYEGGELRFPEYGPHLYSPEAGDAVVFSCALLHEAMPVTAGRRFVLLAFFYGADGERMLQQRGAAAETTT